MAAKRRRALRNMAATARLQPSGTQAAGMCNRADTVARHIPRAARPPAPPRDRNRVGSRRHPTAAQERDSVVPVAANGLDREAAEDSALVLPDPHRDLPDAASAAAARLRVRVLRHSELRTRELDLDVGGNAWNRPIPPVFERVAAVCMRVDFIRRPVDDKDSSPIRFPARYA
jgi:hypothetical protein